MRTILNSLKLTREDRSELRHLAASAVFGVKLALSFAVCGLLAMSFAGGMAIPMALDLIWYGRPTA